jgi:hypothetical protein
MPRVALIVEKVRHGTSSSGHLPPAAEGGDLGPELLGEIPAQLQRLGQPLLLLVQQTRRGVRALNRSWMPSRATTVKYR